MAANQPLNGVAAHIAGTTGVGCGGAVQNHPAQPVTPLGLHHGMAVHLGGETGANADDNGGVGDGCAGIVLGENHIHHSVGLQQGNALGGGVSQHGNHALLQNGESVGDILGPAGGDTLYRGLPKTHAFRECNRPANGGRLLQIRHHKADAGSPQA